MGNVMEASEQWHFPYWNDELANYAHDLLFASDAPQSQRVCLESWCAREPMSCYQTEHCY